jgi:hypothetical protein
MFIKQNLYKIDYSDVKNTCIENSVQNFLQ